METKNNIKQYRLNPFYYSTRQIITAKFIDGSVEDSIEFTTEFLNDMSDVALGRYFRQVLLNMAEKTYDKNQNYGFKR